MEERKLFDYETESGRKPMFPRNNFRNQVGMGAILGFPFQMEEANNLYNHPYDVYQDSETNSQILVVEGDAHCHAYGKTAVYEEGIVLNCKPEHKEELIKKISRAI